MQMTITQNNNLTRFGSLISNWIAQLNPSVITAISNTKEDQNDMFSAYFEQGGVFWFP